MSLKSLNKKILKGGRAVYWAPDGTDDFGQPIYAEAVEIACRWEDTNEQFINQAGEQAVSKSKIWVDRDLQLGGMLAKGTIEGLVSQNNPFDNPDAGEIRGVNKRPDIRQKVFFRWVLL